MRTLIFSLLLANAAIAQSPISRILEQGLKDAAQTFKLKEEKNRVLSARGNDQLPRFIPGPGASVLQKQPAGTPNDLPPGMTRGR